MLLFNDTAENLLPYDGELIYFGQLFGAKKADDFYNMLLQDIEWKQDEAIIFGKRILTKRKVAWYADAEFPYTYSNITRAALPWTETLLTLKKIAEEHTKAEYNACLLNLYHDGKEGVGWHSDDEVTLTPQAAIASLSFGAARKFSFKHKITKETKGVILEHGALIVMKGETQKNWLHSIPKMMKVTTPRISLTFRKMIY